MEIQPTETYDRVSGDATTLLIACGALAREIVYVIDANRWKAFDIQCLPAKWHNTPQFILPGVREKIRAARSNYKKIYVLYGDCGTGGLLDAMLQEEGVERIEGPHCYAFFSGNSEFAKTADADFTSFYLTDYLARHFDKLIWQGLGLQDHPELLPLYFGNYEKIIYLAQTQDAALIEKAKAAAARLGLAFEYRFTGYGELASELQKLAKV